MLEILDDFWDGRTLDFANVMFEILDYFSSSFLEFLWTGIQSPRFCKRLWILNQGKWILVVEIPTQIMLTYWYPLITLQGVDWMFT